MEEDYSELALKCMDFTNQFKHSSHFSFSVNFDTFSFTVTHSKSRKGTEETQGKKKYVSPSNRRRDQRRLKAFLEKKAQHCYYHPIKGCEGLGFHLPRDIPREVKTHTLPPFDRMNNILFKEGSE